MTNPVFAAEGSEDLNESLIDKNSENEDKKDIKKELNEKDDEQYNENLEESTISSKPKSDPMEIDFDVLIQKTTTVQKSSLSQNEDPTSEILTTVNVENVENDLQTEIKTELESDFECDDVEDLIKFNKTEKTKKSIRSNVDRKKKRKFKAVEIDNTLTRYVCK